MLQNQKGHRDIHQGLDSFLEFKADGDQEPECHPAQSFDSSKAPEILFA